MASPSGRSDTIPQFDPADLQLALIAVIDAWYDHDEGALAALGNEQLSEQVKAREVLDDFVGDYREQAKLADEQAVYHASEWQVTAGGDRWAS